MRPPAAAATVDLTSPTAARVYVTVPVVALLAAVIAVAAASLVQDNLRTVSLLALWALGGETLLAGTSELGARLTPLMPFLNARNFVGLAAPEIPWNGAVSGIYFLTVAVALVTIALVHQTRTDVPST